MAAPLASPVPASPSSSPGPAGWSGATPSRVQGNPHPYAIKTTSSAALSRSNSSTAPHRHFYVPPSPAAARHRPSKSLDLAADDAALPALNGRPGPLPTPPAREGSSGSASPDGDADGAPRRTQRADTLPSVLAGGADPAAAALAATLPPNPKAWTPAQLGAYLTSALRVRGGESGSGFQGAARNAPLPPRIARSIAALVRDAEISGRAFLRLDEDDLAQLGVNKLWRTALLTASRNLRQAVLRGRIWGFAEPRVGVTPGDVDAEGDVPPSPGGLEFSDEAALAALADTPLLDRAGTGDDADDADGNVRPGIRPRAESLARLEATHIRRARSGRVKGMVQHLERGASGSESDASEGADDVSPRASIIRARDVFNSPGSQSPPWPTPAAEERAEEPSMAALLAQLDDADADGEEDADAAGTLAAKTGARGSWGARAWEADGAPLETVRHVPAAVHAASISRASMRRAGAPAPSVSTLFAPDTVTTEEPEPIADIPDIPDGVVAAALPDDADASATYIAQLEADLARSRAQLADMLARLAAVEARMDAVDAAHGATAAERDAARAAVHERDAALATAQARVRALEAEAASRERALTRKTPAPVGERALPALGELPGYVLLIGLGVCAVALQVVLRRVGARKLR